MEEQITGVNRIDISEMTEAQWLGTRRSYIGGSDAGKVFLMSKYGSPLTVYFDKKGLVPYSEKAAARRGKLLEPVVRDYTVREFGVTIEQSNYMYVSVAHPFMSANLDGIFIANSPVIVAGVEVVGFGGHEIKTSKMGDGFTADEVPDDYYCQVQHYMAVTGLRWFILSVYEIMSDEVRHYYIPRNDEFIDRLIAAEGAFWENFVLKNVTPAPIGIENEEDLITGMYSPSDGVIVLTEAEIELCRIRTDASAREKSAKEEKERADCALKLAITNRTQGSPAGTGKLSAVAGSFSISWSRFPQRRVDSDLLKKDGLYDKYSKEGESGRFVVNPPKVAV